MRGSEKMLAEFRYTVRVLQRSPAFAATAILAMALGTAACTAVFSFVYALLIRPLPIPRPQDVVSIYSTSKVKGGFGSLSMPDYRDLAVRDDLFEAVGAYVRLPFLVDDDTRSDRVYGELPTGNYHTLLGLRPAMGRLLTPDDDRPGASMVVVLSHRFWHQRFAGSPDAIGRMVRLNAQPTAIVGVMPESFRGILLDWGGAPDLWVPVSQLSRLSPAFARADVEENRGAPWLQVNARLRAGITPRIAEAALREQASRLARAYPATNADTTFSVLSAARARFWPGRRAEAIDLAAALFAAVAILLAIAVLNVANLQLARLATRQQELSVRVAIGATQGRLVRQLLIEGLVVSWAAAVVSVPLSLGMMQLISRMNLPLFVSERSLDLGPDWRIFVMVASVSTVIGLLLGLAPALQAWRGDVRSGMMGTISSKRTMIGIWDLRHTLAAAQVAICVVLAIGAGLLSKSVIGLLRADLGFSPDRVTLFGLESYLRPSSEEGESFTLSRELLARVRQLPGVEAVALAHDVLPTPMRSTKEVIVPEPGPGARTVLSVPYNVVTPGYFETVRMPLVAGRTFNERDSNTSAAVVAIVNELLAQRLWREPALAVGQRIRVAGEPAEREIVGVARNAVYREIDEAPLPYLFLPDDRAWSGVMTLHVRGPREPSFLIEEVRRELRQVDRSLAFADIRTMNDHVASRMAGSSLAAHLSLAASAAGLALAVMGLYAVLAYLVSLRRTEIAIRMSVGANPAHIVRFILGMGLRITLLGLLAGLFGSFAATRLIASQLRGVSVDDPLVYCAVLGLVFFAALGACLLPARRAASLEPWGILRRS